MLKKIRGKIENNPIWKFRIFWNNLNQGERRDMWNILTALRGQDKDSDPDVKHSTTGRIRGELFAGDQLGYDLLVCINYPTLAEDIRMCREKLFDTPTHFQRHIQDATISLAKYIFKKRVNDLYKITRLDRS